MLLDFYTKVQTWFVDLRERARSERGASAVEYGLLVALIAAIISFRLRARGTPWREPEGAHRSACSRATRASVPSSRSLTMSAVAT